MTDPEKLFSPNHDERPTGARVEWVVLHYTGMTSAKAALARLCDPAAKVSAHYVIDEDGTISQLVAEDRRAWHAGISAWAGQENLNHTSLGIELVNPGHEFGYRPFPAPQIGALEKLLADIWARHQLPVHALLAHSDIAPARKQDPGELFPWQELSRKNFGLWPHAAVVLEGEKDMPTLRRWLRIIGYDCAETGDYDQHLRYVLLAFQRRYQPYSVSGNPEPSTLALIKGLAEAMAS